MFSPIGQFSLFRRLMQSLFCQLIQLLFKPSPTKDGQYLVFWNHEGVIATENGVEHLSPQQQALLLIRF
jgi:hypothetical protein